MKLDVQSIAVAIDGRPVLSDLSLQVDAGHMVGIIGPNGSGKTTLMKALRGLYPLAAGHVYWDGQDMAGADDKTIARKMAYMQQSVDISFEYTVKDIVLAARYPYLAWWRQERDEDRHIAEQAMREVGVWHLRDRSVRTISGGERQRVFLAKALAQQTDVLLLDEPTSALDLGYADDIFHQCRTWCDSGKTILVVVHDLELAAKYCSRLVLMADGGIVKAGTVSEVLRADYVSRAFRVSVAVYEDPYFEQRRIYTFPRDAAPRVMPAGDDDTLPPTLTMASYDPDPET